MCVRLTGWDVRSQSREPKSRVRLGHCAEKRTRQDAGKRQPSVGRNAVRNYGEARGNDWSETLSEVPRAADLVVEFTADIAARLQRLARLSREGQRKMLAHIGLIPGQL